MKKNSMIYKDQYSNNLDKNSIIFLIAVSCIGIAFLLPLISCSVLSSCNNYGGQGANYLFGILGITITIISIAILIFKYIKKSNTKKNIEKIIKYGTKVEGRIIRYKRGKPFDENLQLILLEDQKLREMYSSTHYRYADSPYYYQVEVEYIDPRTNEKVRFTTPDIIGNPEIYLFNEKCEVYLYKGKEFVPKLELIRDAKEEIPENIKQDIVEKEGTILEAYSTYEGTIIKVCYKNDKDEEEIIRLFTGIIPERLENNKCTLCFYKKDIYLKDYSFLPVDVKESKNGITVKTIIAEEQNEYYIDSKKKDIELDNTFKAITIFMILLGIVTAILLIYVNIATK